MSAEPHGSASGPGTARAQAAGPVLGGHPALARRLDVTEADRAGTRADQDGAAADLELARRDVRQVPGRQGDRAELDARSEEHTSELQSRRDLVCRLLLEKKK